MANQPAGADTQTQERMRNLAKCMREHGVGSFPDPEPGGGVRLDAQVQQDPDFAKAQKLCMGNVLGTPRSGGNG
ncbi:hypothetical protein ACIBHX_44175 [Nonomuraea sp. NPDC050536]|uniref:hypothetical protein n=1 Tax=Nonomuraea sp. NPDC050536 TaxID=3364366 RepID=UPI0037CBB2E4